MMRKSENRFSVRKTPEIRPKRSRRGSNGQNLLHFSIDSPGNPPERRMLDLAQAVREQIVKETPPRKGERARAFTVSSLWRLALWGVTAVGALSLAVLTSRSDVGSERIASLLHGGRQQQARAFDAQVETQWLAEAVRGLAADGNQMKSRLAAVERDMTDVTGSISKEIDAVESARQAAPGPTIAATAAATLAMPVIPAHTGAATPTEYAVDIGSGLTVEALRTRRLSIYSAYPQLFEGMKPIVSVRELPRGNRVELRLMVGPIARSDGAARLCTSLTQFGLFCQPTIYDGQRSALR